LPCSTKPSNGRKTRVIFRYGGYIALKDSAHLKEQALLSGLTDDEIAGLAALGAVAPLRGRTAHRRRRGAGIVAVLPAERHGQREAAERRAACEPRPGHGISAKWRCWKSGGRRRLGRHRGCMLELPIDEFNKFRVENPHAGRAHRAQSRRHPLQG